MLKALYDYAIRQKLTLPPGYANKLVKAYVCLDSQGHYLGIQKGDDQPVPCPDIGSMANSKEKCNLIVEKFGILFPNGFTDKKDYGKYVIKNRFFMDALTDAGAYEDKCIVCRNALEDETLAESIIADLSKSKLAETHTVSFIVDGTPLIESEKLLEWWNGFRKQFAKNDDAQMQRCMITGEMTVPVATVKKVTGLHSVGGHASGDALICFDKAAFCSYGLKQAANAAVSEEAMSAVKAALDDLLQEAPALEGAHEADLKTGNKHRSTLFARNLGGMKFVHWYDTEVEKDIADAVFDGEDDFSFDFDDDWEPAQQTHNPLAEKRKADTLVQSYRTGDTPTALSGQYYILLLTGVGGRIMIRSYQQGRYEDLYQHVCQWNEDLRLCSASGNAPLKAKKLTGRLISLMKKQSSNKRLYERISKELSGIIPGVLNAIFTGNDLPDAVLTRALAYIRSDMFGGSEDENRTMIPDGTACQWLKACLCRKERKEGEEVTMAYCNPNHPKAAYHCGRMMAVYANIQKEALGKVNAGVVERYYASASQTPALVLGRLAMLANHHLAKIENPGAVKRLNEKLEEISVALGDGIPVTLTLEEQAYFALGYRQQWAEMNRERMENAAKKKAQNAETASEDAEEETEE